MNVVTYPSMLRNYYNLRYLLAKRRFDAIKDDADVTEESATDLWYAMDCWKDKVNTPSWYEGRHRCTHHRHSAKRPRHSWHRWRVGYNHYPVKLRPQGEREYSYYLLFWGYKGHRAVDIVFKWNLYCFSLNTGKLKSKLPPVASEPAQL